MVLGFPQEFSIQLQAGHAAAVAGDRRFVVRAGYRRGAARRACGQELHAGDVHCTPD